MRKDISFPSVQGVKIAILRSVDAYQTVEWRVHIINLNRKSLKGVFITSRGYGEIDGEVRSTSTLRHAFVEIGPESLQFVEVIDPQVFGLNNEYWVSYYIDEQIYDKRFIFVPDSIVEQNLTNIPLSPLTGILHN